MARIQKILVVGGGTAGWLTACYLAKALNSTKPESIQVELVESPNIGLLGVGEATFPSIRGTLAAIGLDERRFLVGATATFKQGIQYVNWVRPPGTPGPDRFFHPFSLPSQRAGSPELLPYWLLGAAPAGMPFAEAVTMQQRIVDAGRAPKRATDGGYLGPMNYAYHFDASCFATVLAEHGQSLGVKRLLATVGWRSTSKAAVFSSTPSCFSGASSRATRATSRCILGGLPSSTSIGMSITRSPPGPSSRISSLSSVATPTMANGQRSRSHICSNSGSRSGFTARV